MIEKHEINALMKAVGGVVKDHVAKAIAENNAKAEAEAKARADAEAKVRAEIAEVDSVKREAAREAANDDEMMAAAALADLFVKGLSEHAVA